MQFLRLEVRYVTIVDVRRLKVKSADIAVQCAMQYIRRLGISDIAVSVNCRLPKGPSGTQNDDTHVVFRSRIKGIRRVGKS